MSTKLISIRIGTELLDYLQKRAEKEHRTLSNMIIAILSEEAESVRHGYWIDDCTCSVCLWTHTNPDGYALVTNYDYCPTCGTKMDGGEGKNDARETDQNYERQQYS